MRGFTLVFVPVLVVCVVVNLSCGYRPEVARVPGGGGEIAIPMVRNYTSIRDLQVPFTTTLRKRVARSGIDVATHKDCARLDVSLLMVTSGPGMVGIHQFRLESVDSIETIAAEARIVNAQGEIVAGPSRIEVRARAYAAGNPRSDILNQERKWKQLLEDLTDEIISQLLTQ